MKIFLEEAEMLKAFEVYFAIRGYQLKGQYSFNISDGKIDFVGTVATPCNQIDIEKVIGYARSNDLPNI